MYTALVLLDESVKELKDRHAQDIPDDWTVKCHHMTCNMSKAENGPAATHLGMVKDLTVTHIAKNEHVVAVAVESVVPSNNIRKHITLAVNEVGGGKAQMSNDLSEWVPVTPFLLRGVVMEVY